MAIAPRYNFTMYQGETWKPILRLTDVNGTPVDLTGYTVKMELRDRPGGKLLATPTLTITPATGQINIVLAKTATVLITQPVVVYSIVLTTPATEAVILLRGEVNVEPRVTQ